MATKRTFVKTTGMKELEAALSSLTKATARNVLTKTLKSAAEPMQKEWQNNAPVKTGKYRNSIIVGKRPSAAKIAYTRAIQSTNNPKIARMAAKAAKKQSGQSFAEIAVGAAKNVRQAVPLEFGTEAMAPQPSARPAWDATQNISFNIIQSDLAENLNKAIERAERKAARLAAKIKK